MLKIKKGEFANIINLYEVAYYGKRWVLNGGGGGRGDVFGT